MNDLIDKLEFRTTNQILRDEWFSQVAKEFDEIRTSEPKRSINSICRALANYHNCTPAKVLYALI